jgi:hypothetical protein
MKLGFFSGSWALFLAGLIFSMGLTISPTDGSIHIIVAPTDRSKAKEKLNTDGSLIGAHHITDRGFDTIIYRQTIHRLFSAFTNGGLKVFLGCGVVIPPVPLRGVLDGFLRSFFFHSLTYHIYV